MAGITPDWPALRACSEPRLADHQLRLAHRGVEPSAAGGPRAQAFGLFSPTARIRPVVNRVMPVGHRRISPPGMTEDDQAASAHRLGTSGARPKYGGEDASRSAERRPLGFGVWARSFVQIGVLRIGPPPPPRAGEPVRSYTSRCAI